MENNYIAFCEQLHQQWLNNYENDDVLNDIFQMEYSPEPYFKLENGSNPLYMLLTNPGDGMDFQHKKNIVKSDYETFAKEAAKIYTSENFKTKYSNAYRRLRKSIDLAKNLGYDSVINVETIPFHSATLNKSKALKALSISNALIVYQNELKTFLKEKPVVIVAACSTKCSISVNTITNNDWLMYQAKIANIDIEKLKMKELTNKDNKITSALFSEDNKHIVLMMGSNNIPTIK
jgi:hypothetical protein